MNKNILTISKTILKTSIISFFVFLILDAWWPGLIANYLNINWLVIIIIADSIVFLFLNKEEEENKNKKQRFLFNILFGILFFVGSLIFFDKINAEYFIASCLAGATGYLIADLLS